MHTNTKIAGVALAAVAVAASGVSYAYWTTSGSGEGAGATTAGVVDRLAFTQAPLQPMFPGDQAQPLRVTVRNGSAESAHVGTVKAFVTTKSPGCTGADFLLGGSPAASSAGEARALAWTATELAAGAAAEATSTLSFNSTGADQDACKSAQVTVHYLAS